jgi:hypothetical protein
VARARFRGAVLAATALVVGCGRVGFAPDDVVDAAAPGVDAAVDPATVCPTYAPRAGFPRWLRASTLDQSWAEAVATCEQSGGRLLVPTSAATYAALVAQITADARAGDPAPQQWLGLTDTAEEGTFVAPALQGDERPYLAWLAGEPNNGGKMPVEEEDCVVAYDAGYNDEGCGTGRGFWCECDVPPP